MNHKYKSTGKYFFAIELILDIIFLAVCYVISFHIIRPYSFPQDYDLLVIFLLHTSAIALVVFAFNKTNKCGEETYLNSLFSSFISIVIIALLTILVDYAIKGIGAWRSVVFYACLMQAGVFTLYKLLAFKLYQAQFGGKPAAIIGKSIDETAEFALKLISTHNHLYKIEALIQQNDVDLEKNIDTVQNIFICSGCSHDVKNSILAYCSQKGKLTHVVPCFEDVLINSGEFDVINDVPVFTMSGSMEVEDRIIKRTIDIVISILGIILCSPLLLFAAVGIKIQDRGPIMYRQTRVTEGGRHFIIYKLRTMKIDAEKDTGAVLSELNDIRITWLGRFLRAARIDEIPQFFNVLSGDMSIIGPRPERPELIKFIVKEIPEFKYRTIVKAGLTGLAQVMGKYNTSFRDKLMLDLYYVKNHSFMLDFKILFSTIRVIFKPSASAGLSSQDKSSLELLAERGYNFKTSKEV